MRPHNDSEGKWLRVSSQSPCPICNKTDWCLIAPDGSAVICPRVEEGSIKECYEAGWLHRLKENKNQKQKSNRLSARIIIKASSSIDFAALSKNFQAAVDPKSLQELSAELGVSEKSLKRLNVGWSARDKAWTFPMTAVTGVTAFCPGILLRHRDGSKQFLKGSKLGLFIPDKLNPHGQLLITEGVTDLAAVLDLGFSAIARPSCNSGKKQLVQFIKNNSPSETVIIADADNPGMQGAHRLAATLAGYCRDVKVIFPPDDFKDFRAWKMAGATENAVIGVIAVTPLVKLHIKGKVS